MTMRYLKIPQRINPDEMKDQDLNKYSLPATGRMFCGECGHEIKTEHLIEMNHQGHSLWEYGIYEIIIDSKGQTLEGWGSRPSKTRPSCAHDK